MKWQTLRDNPTKWEIVRKRRDLIGNIREFFRKEGFLEVQTPLLTSALIPESYLEVFETELRDKMDKKWRAFLTTSPEMWHKKLLAAGSGNIFEITKSFRNTDIGGHFHNPEFTLLEWYRVNTDYKGTMKDCENLVRYVLGDRKSKVRYQGDLVDVSGPFERLSIIDAFQKYANIDEKVLFDKGALAKEAKKREYFKKGDWETAFNMIYLKEIEPNLGFDRPAFVYDFPAEFAPLAKTSETDPRIKERFELYMFGIELGDAYNELTDPIEQEKEFKKEIRLRRKLRKVDYPADADFIEALKSGLPQCSGVALGIDRLLMILADKTDINDVTLFSGNDLFDSE